MDAILNSVPDAVLCINQYGVIQYCNAAVEKIFGRSPHELEGQRVETLMAGPDRASHQRHVERYLTTGESGILNKGPRLLEAVHSDGRIVPIELAIGEISSGGEHEFIGVCRDVSERILRDAALRDLNQELSRRVEEYQSLSNDLEAQVRVARRILYAAEAARKEAQQLAARLKLALSAGQTGVIDLDLGQGSIWASPEVETILGRPVTFQDFAARPWSMCHPEDRARLDHVIADWTGPRHEPLEFRIVPPSGEARWIEVHGERLPSAGASAGRIISLVVDIDARKRQELALIAAEQAAQDAASAKSQFLANMSHEIRTPMNGILGVLGLLGAEPLNADGRKLLTEAQKCGRMLMQLLSDVIDVSRIEAGRLELLPEPVDAADVLESVVALLRPQAEVRGVSLRTRVEGASAWIMADPVRLNQALFNLIGNAVKFTVKGWVEARLSVRPDPAGRTILLFEIQDTGVGIPESAQASLFERFNRGDSSTASRFGGTGLGLAITKALAAAMDGDLDFESADGVGSTFRLRISAPPAADGASPPRPAEHALLDGMRILVVEDNPTNRIIATRMLETLGASVDVAEDGLDGLGAVQANPYDLVLMDVQMPRMDGLEATRRIRALAGAAAHVPIIALTANAMTHQREQCAAAGMDSVVSKPISPAVLVEEILRVKDDLGSTAAPRASLRANANWSN